MGAFMDQYPIRSQTDEAIDLSDHSTWGLLIEEYGPLLLRVARSCGLDQPDCADVCQTTWLRLFEHADQISQPSRVRAWLVTTARREAIRVSRTIRKDICVADLSRVGDALIEAGPEGVADAGETRSEVARAIGRLPQRNQDVVRLLMVDPPPRYTDVAAELDMPLGSVGPTWLRSLAQLRGDHDILASAPSAAVDQIDLTDDPYPTEPSVRAS